VVLLIPSLISKMIALRILRFEGGSISIQGRNVVFMPTDVLVRMHAELEEAGLVDPDQILFRLGRYQTETGSKRYLDARKDIARSMGSVSMTGDPALERGREVLKFTGWGDTRIESIQEGGRKITLRTIGSPIAKAYLDTRGKSGKPVCHYLRGLLLGVVESVHGPGYSVREVSCKACGTSDECIFELVRGD